MAVPDRPHLRDLYSEGEDMVVKVWRLDEMQEVHIFLQRPNPIDQQEAQRKGRASRARLKSRLSEGDERDALVQEAEAMDKKKLSATLISYSKTDFEAEATNELLYNKDVGDDWSDEGRELGAITEAYQTRWVEITEINEQRVLDEIDILPPEDDEELIRLQAIVSEYEEQVLARAEELKEDELKKLMRLGRSELEKHLIEKNVQIECDLEFFQTYQLHMIYQSARMPEDHSELYFKSAKEFLSYPQMVRAQITNAYEAMEMGVDDIKNWLSLLNSSDSSE